MKKGLIAIGIMVGFVLSILMVSGAMAAKDEVVFSGGSQGKVTFTHKKHAENYKIDCLKCHHTWKKGETTGQMCKECHKAEAAGKTLSAKDAYHQDCYKSCHTEAKKAKKPAGPTVCNQCHVKAK
jgi:hypothetical protein